MVPLPVGHLVQVAGRICQPYLDEWQMNVGHFSTLLVLLSEKIVISELSLTEKEKKSFKLHKNGKI